MSAGTDRRHDSPESASSHTETHSSTAPKQHDSLTPDLPDPHQIHVSITTANTTRHYPQRFSWIPVPTWAFITCEHKTHSSCTDSGTTRCSHPNKNTLNDWRQPTKVCPDLWSSFFNFPSKFVPAAVRSIWSLIRTEAALRLRRTLFKHHFGYHSNDP